MIADVWNSIKAEEFLGFFATIAVLAIIANQLIGIVKHFRPQWIRGHVETSERDEWATKTELQRLETSVHNQFTEVRDYLHKSVHDIKEDMQNHWLKSDVSREKLFETVGKEGRRVDSRINDVLEAVSELRGAFTQSQRRHFPND